MQNEKRTYRSFDSGCVQARNKTRLPAKADEWFTLTVHIEVETVKAFHNYEHPLAVVVKKLNSTKTCGITG